jgi:ethanolamine ammonia-lyase small subunit
MEPSSLLPANDPWVSLNKFTTARIALGRTGVSIPLRENLSFRMAHAFARDAVYTTMDTAELAAALTGLSFPFLLLKSRAIDRGQYLQRPDLGRRLDDHSLSILSENAGPFDVCINVADGLSANAINHHATPLLTLLLPRLLAAGLTVAPICIIEQGRVAISDETGSALSAKISIILIGERPGLSSPDSLGVYLTYHPEVGNTDHQRNCISNIGPNGLSYQAAAVKIHFLVTESLRLQLSGVSLKDLSGFLEDK